MSMNETERNGRNERPAEALLAAGVAEEPGAAATDAVILPPDDEEHSGKEEVPNAENEADEDGQDDGACVLCRNVVTTREHAIFCDICNRWFHQRCMRMNAAEYRTNLTSEEEWHCMNCRQVQPAENPDEHINISWGEMTGLGEVQIAVQGIHAKITTWQKNIFELPRGKAGKDFIAETTRLLQLFNNKTLWEPVAIHLLIIFLPLMLQKPSIRSKSKDHRRYLEKRLQMWKDGELEALMAEAEEVQRRLSASKKKKEAAVRGFSKLMMLGKVRQALKLVDAESDICGVHKLTDEVRQTLQEKHPRAEPSDPAVLLPEEPRQVQAVIF